MAPRTRLGEILLDAGIITQDQLDRAVEQRRAADGRKPRLETILVENGYAGGEVIARTIAQALNLPFIDLTTVDVDPEVVQMIPRWLAERHQLVPVRRTGDGVMVAMTDPSNLVALDDVRVSARVGRVSVGVAAVDAIADASERIYSVDSAAAEILDRLGTAAEVEVLPEADDDSDQTLDDNAEEMAPIIQLTNALLADAVRGRATDVHVEPQPTEVDVRYRVDGLLREVMTLPKHIQGLVVSRLKIMAGMDIAERRRPQDGRTRILVDGREVDTRVSTIPTLSGEKLVIRLLYKSQEKSSLDALGLEDDQLETLRQHLMLSQGLIVFTGPTGSGKTSTMYAALSQMPISEKNMVTLEDPIEYQIAGVNQVQVDEKVGVTFARGLRSFLRQDPDVIMVGEIRDLETAQIVLQSSLTGHLVLSSLHTNDAPSAITRLVDIGVEPFLIASALSLAVAQRLVRVICPHCRQESPVAERTLKLLGLTDSDIAGVRLEKGVGCEECGYTGYLGRTGIFEVLPITPQLREQIGTQVSDAVISEAARATGVMSLRDAGLKKVRDGITTLEEVLRVTYVEQQDVRRCPGCRHEIETSFVVCPYCQTDLTANTCSSCGKDTEPEWRVCPYCRHDLPSNDDVVGRDRRRLLIVDDDADVLEMTAMMFGEDFDVLVATTGEEAIRRATLERPDVILLDLGLPDVRGTEVTRRLRDSALTSLIPVIMITGEEGAELESLRSGVDDHISKPFDADKLGARINSAIARATRSARSPFMVTQRKSALRRSVLQPRVETVIRQVQESIRNDQPSDTTATGEDPPAAAAEATPAPETPSEKAPVAARPKRANPRTRKAKVAAATSAKARSSSKKTSNGSGPETTIEFKIPEDSLVSIALYNERGTLVRRLISSEQM
ncbi:MAG: Flp pilus assembly complex ATPase component TadA, partial [Actinobacteria bacterium]|nr:Flp pilus assembly complex ATPase component TadA [Actinomycetota bacterium]